jgi:hypothetical protein
VAEPTLIGRAIAARPSFALTASYELLMRQVRESAGDRPALIPAGDGAAGGGPDGSGELQRRAWQWALANRRPDGSLPTGTEVAGEFRRSDRWGRLVKKTGLTGHLDTAA